MNVSLKVHASEGIIFKGKKKCKEKKKWSSKLEEEGKRGFEGSNGKKDNLAYNYFYLLSRILF